jgi:DNA-binding response OmpR family regulator
MIATCKTGRSVQPRVGPILIVDDDADIRELIGQILERDGFRILEAGDGRTALALALERRPALVILDLRLPLVGGETVASRLHAVYSSTVPILVVSAEPDAEDIAARIGAIACLAKPFSAPCLRKIVRDALAHDVVSQPMPSPTSMPGSIASGATRSSY